MREYEVTTVDAAAGYVARALPAFGSLLLRVARA
jgi:hypothetical protein